jgi:hypothetical protein
MPVVQPVITLCLWWKLACASHAETMAQVGAGAAKFRVETMIVSDVTSKPLLPTISGLVRGANRMGGHRSW